MQHRAEPCRSLRRSQRGMVFAWARLLGSYPNADPASGFGHRACGKVSGARTYAQATGHEQASHNVCARYHDAHPIDFGGHRTLRSGDPAVARLGSGYRLPPGATPTKTLGDGQCGIDP